MTSSALRRWRAVRFTRSACVRSASSGSRPWVSGPAPRCGVSRFSAPSARGPSRSTGGGGIALASLSRRLTETATLSTLVGRAVLTGVGNALALVRQPALALDRMGFVLDANAAADGVLDNDVRICNRRLAVRDKAARSRLDALLDQVRTAREADPMPAEPIVVRRIDKRPVVIRVLPIDGAARSPFLGARVLLLLTDLERKPRTNAQMLAAAFGLSPAETRLAVHIAAGLSPEMAAEEIGIAVNTARNQLKSILAKTDTHRQGELVALLARLGSI